MKLTTKPQGNYDNLIAEFEQEGGRISKCPTVLAKGSEAVRATKEMVARKRREERKAK